MSQENVDATHKAFDAFNRRDLAGYIALLDEDVEFTPYEVAVQGGEPYRGHAGVRAWWEESLAVFPDLKGEVHEVRASGDMTFAGGRLHAQGAGSGAPIGRPMWLAIRWRDGKQISWHAFPTREEALEAVGLAE